MLLSCRVVICCCTVGWWYVFEAMYSLGIPYIEFQNCGYGSCVDGYPGSCM